MHGKEQRDLMSAVSARSVSHTLGVDRVRALQRVLYRCAKQNQDRRFHALYDKVARSDVIAAPGARSVLTAERRASMGSPSATSWTRGSTSSSTSSPPGCAPDGIGRDPCGGCIFPKPGKPGQVRPLGIPCVADRVVMAAAKIVLEPIFEADFLPTSYGFRPGRSAHHALETIRQTVTWRGKQWALDADIRSCI